MILHALTSQRVQTGEAWLGWNTVLRSVPPHCPDHSAPDVLHLHGLLVPPRKVQAGEPSCGAGRPALPRPLPPILRRMRDWTCISVPPRHGSSWVGRSSPCYCLSSYQLSPPIHSREDPMPKVPTVSSKEPQNVTKSRSAN